MSGVYLELCCTCQDLLYVGRAEAELPCVDVVQHQAQSSPAQPWQHYVLGGQMCSGVEVYMCRGVHV